MHNKTHGMYQTRTYKIWAAMKSRCQDTNNVQYPRYGGRGITVCADWQTFEGFFADMGIAAGVLTLERVDVNGDYCKTNCTWVSRKAQARNRRNNRLLTVNGETKTCSEWAETSGISRHLLYSRLKRQWDEAEAVFTPPHGDRMALRGEVDPAKAVFAPSKRNG